MIRTSAIRSSPSRVVSGVAVPRPPRRRRRRFPNGDVAHPAGNALGAMLVALVLGLLLNADSIYVKADTQAAGWERQVGVTVMGPVRAISRFTLLDRPRTMFDKTFRENAPGRRGGSVAVPITTSTTLAPPVVRLRVPDTADPVRLWVGGDSMSQVFGQSVVAKAVERGDIAATLDYRISSGLTQPDFFDWPTHLQDSVLPDRPEVVVIMFGANDAQSMDVAGDAVDVRSPRWQAEYRQRVAAAMDQLSGDGRLVVWVGQPAMRSDNFDARQRILDVIYREEASRRTWIRFVDTRAILSTDGTYTAYLPGRDGTPALMRQSDGIHLSRAGGDRLADAVLALVDAEAAKSAAAGGAVPTSAPPRPPGPASSVTTAPPVTTAPASPPPPPSSAPPTTAGWSSEPWFAIIGPRG